MKQLTKEEFVALVVRHNSGGQPAEGDIRNVKLSGFQVPLELDAITIAMSTLENLTFNAASTLYGVAWIGNEIQGCSFFDVPMNKSEILNCTFVDSRFFNVALFRTDLSGTIFKHCVLEGVDLSNACLINASFEDCTFSNLKVNAKTFVNGRKSIYFDFSGGLVVESVGESDH